MQGSGIYTKNLPQEQDMVAHAAGRYRATGFVIPPKQRAIYNHLAKDTGKKLIIEVGCGIGVGAAIMRGKPFIYKGQEACHRVVLATDYKVEHIDFAQQLHPHGIFDVWDVETGPYPAKLYQMVVAVEVIEHLADPEEALKNMALTCSEEVWISTPNRQAPDLSSDGPPFNTHHVQEFTPREVLELGSGLFTKCEILDWNFNPVQEHTEETPLVYHFTL